jgi:hypothetical protein
MSAHLSPVQALPMERPDLANCEKRIVRIYESFEDLPVAYHKLFGEAAAKNFFLGLPWYQNLVHKALEKGDQARILGVELQDGVGTAVAALPVRHSRGKQAGWKLRTLSSLSNYYSSSYEPVFHPAYSREESLRAMAQAICSENPPWNAVNLKPLDPDSPVFSELVQSLRQAGMVVQTYFCHGNWYYPVCGRSYKEYLESLRSSVRNIARSKNKKLERTGRARVEITTGLDGLDSAIQAYQKVYAASWKVPEPFTEFVPGLIRTCAEMGWLRLGVAYIDNEPAAAQVWIVNSGAASIYKIAYDQKFKELSVGSYLTTHLMERVIDVDKVREIDYLSGDDRYKSDWMSHRREHWGILAMNPRTLPGALAVIRHVGGRAAKQAARRILTAISNKRGKSSPS